MKRIKFLNRIFLYTSFILLVFSLAPAKSIGQTDSTAVSDKQEETSITPLVTFVTVQKSDNSIDLKATFKAKIKGNLTQLSGLMIRFVYAADSVEKELGEVMTDMNGTGIYNCKADALTADKEGKLHFKVTYAGDKSVEAAEEIVIIKRASLVITPVKEDSILSLKLKLVDLSTGNETAIPETDLGIFVKRLFSPLKIGEGKTDESGELTVEIPNSIPGDANGNITLLAKLEDNEQYGNLEASVNQKWGIPVSDEIKEQPRALWSSNPPLWMLITFIILMTAVWGHYIVIVYELFRLRKEHA